MNLLLEHGADPGTRTSEALCAAVESDHLGDRIEIARLLLRHGARLDLAERRDGGRSSPLDAARELGKRAMARFLSDEAPRKPR